MTCFKLLVICFILQTCIANATYGQIELCESVVFENTTMEISRNAQIFLYPDSLIFNADFEGCNHRKVKKGIYVSKKKYLYRNIYAVRVYSRQELKDSMRIIELECYVEKEVRKNVFSSSSSFKYLIYLDLNDKLLRIERIGGLKPLEIYPKMTMLSNKQFKKLLRKERWFGVSQPAQDKIK